MTEYRSLLERASTSAPPPDLPLERVMQRRDHKRRNQRIRAGVLGIAIAILAGWWGVHAITSSTPKPADDRSEELGIFAPVAGRVVYGNKYGIWAIDPAGPADPSGTVQLTSEAGDPMGWSSDGTRLLIARDDLLFILHADGSETQVTTDPMNIEGAAISPDGSRVVFAGAPDDDSAPYAVYAVDAGGGPAEMLVESQNGVVRTPTFSPDGTRIAYVDDNSDVDHGVWVMNADGSDVHQIVPDPGAGHVYGLEWSPTGDRIALGWGGVESNGIYTFAPDGSNFTQVITDAESPSWSPDGSQLAYSVECVEQDEGCGVGIADADGSNVRTFDFGLSGPWHPAPITSNEPTPGASPPEPRATGEFLVLAPMGTGSGSDIAAEDPETGDLRKIVETDGIVDCPNRSDCVNSIGRAEWSSDGRWVAFQVSSAPDGPCAPTDGVWVQGPIGTPWQLTAPCEATPGARGIQELWAWSPQGARLADVRLNGENRLYVIDPTDGSRIQRLCCGGDLTALEWSPDGTRIAVGADGEGLLEVTADPGAVAGLWSLGDSFDDFAFADVVDIDYSPDGTRIAVLDQAGSRLDVINADGYGLYRLLEGADVCCEGWSPNGDRMVYQLSVENGTGSVDSEVWTVAPDGSDPIEVFDSNGCDMGATDDALPVWAPNGTQVAYNDCGTWVVSNADGTGEPQPIDELVFRSWAGGGLSG